MRIFAPDLDESCLIGARKHLFKVTLEIAHFKLIENRDTDAFAYLVC